MLKAYNVYPGDNPFDEGCILVFAETRNQARLIGNNKGPWFLSYIEINACRVKDFDKHTIGNKPYFVETNDELPEPFFYEGEI